MISSKIIFGDWLTGLCSISLLNHMYQDLLLNENGEKKYLYTIIFLKKKTKNSSRNIAGNSKESCARKELHTFPAHPFEPIYLHGYLFQRGVFGRIPYPSSFTAFLCSCLAPLIIGLPDLLLLRRLLVVKIMGFLNIVYS